MREIKFRGKQTKPIESIWHYGDLIHSKDNKTYIQNITCMEVDKETVGQFTGLRDKNGVEIYEGDILKIPEWLKEDNQDVCICIYNQENTVSDIIGFGLYIKDGYSGKYKILVQSDEWDEFEVIGNIYDNPELLKESD